MEATRFSELKPRNVWDIVDDAFDLYRERFVLLLGCAAIVYIPIFLIRLFVMASAYQSFFQRMVGVRGNSDAALGALMGLFASSSIMMPFWLVAGTVYTAVCACIVEDVLGERRLTTIRESYQPVLRRLVPLVGAGILIGVFSVLGLAACGIGSLYVTTVLSFVPMLILLEAKDLGIAFKRSQDIVRPEFFKVFGMALLLGTVSGILSIGIQAVISTVFEIIPHEGDTAVMQTQQTMLSEALTSVVSLLLAPLTSIALTLLYYDMRVRREGFDIVARAEEMQYPLAPDPFGDVSSEEARRRLQRMRTGGR